MRGRRQRTRRLRWPSSLDSCDSLPLDSCDSLPLDSCDSWPLESWDSLPLASCDSLPLSSCDSCVRLPLDICDSLPLDSCDSLPLDSCDSLTVDSCDSLQLDSCDRLPDCTAVTDLTVYKDHPPSADLRYWEEDSNSSSTLIFAAKKIKCWMYTLRIHPDVPKKFSSEIKLK